MSSRSGLVLATVLVAMSVTPAAQANDQANDQANHQAAGQLGLSWDGQRWSNQLTGSLFDPNERWAPGDERTASFHVRNVGDAGASLTVGVESTDSAQLVRDDGVRLTARFAGHDWVPLEQTGDRYRLAGTALAVGDEAQVDVRAEFVRTATNQTQQRQVALDLRIVLSGTEGPPGDPDGPGLPGTGAPAVRGLLALAATLIGVGFALVRRQKEKAHA